MLKENKPILEEVNLVKWHEKGYIGKGVTIALLDDGGLPREHMKEYYTNVHNPSKDIDHSTNVGYAAYTAAPGIKIVALNGKRDSAGAFKWLEEHKDEIDLINISLAGINGISTPKYLELEKLGIPVICASGNDSFDNKISYPAQYDFTIAIGAWQWNLDFVAYYSNGGPKLDAVAPSSINMLRDDGYIFSKAGTSFASPFACGMLACYIQWRNEQGLPKLKPEEARKFIHDNCFDVVNPGFDYKSGHGLFTMPNIPEDKKEPIPQQKPSEPVPIPIEPVPKEEDIFYRVVTGSFSSRENANYRIETIKAKGISSFLLAENINGNTMFRVITGSFSDRNNAEARKNHLESIGFPSFIAIYRK